MCACVFASVRYRSGENNYYSISMDTYMYTSVLPSANKCIYSNVCFKGMFWGFVFFVFVLLLSKFVVLM